MCKQPQSFCNYEQSYSKYVSLCTGLLSPGLDYFIPQHPVLCLTYFFVVLLAFSCLLATSMLALSPFVLPIFFPIHYLFSFVILSSLFHLSCRKLCYKVGKKYDSWNLIHVTHHKQMISTFGNTSLLKKCGYVCFLPLLVSKPLLGNRKFFASVFPLHIQNFPVFLIFNRPVHFNLNV